jgi:hydrogenase large subunit
VVTRIVIDPVTRIEGHLKIDATVEAGRVAEARCSGTMFRGLETILRGRDPRDAQRITQRICGVCPSAHATASALALDDAFGIADRIPDNGRVIRNLIFGSNYIQSHILHFYHLVALDFVDVAAVAGYRGSDERLRQVSSFIARGSLAPFFPRYEGDYRLTPEQNRAAVAHYVEALDMRRHAHEMEALFGGKMPHSMGIFAGGALEQVTVDKITAFRWRLERLRDFIDNVYIPDVLMVASAYPDYFETGGGCRRYLAYGCWDLDSEPDLTRRRRLLPNGTVDAGRLEREPLEPSRITEHIRHSWYRGRSDLPPRLGETDPDPSKHDAYSFLKAPRYGDEVMEVGPLARMLVAYVNGDGNVRAAVDGLLAGLGAEVEALFSVLGRHAARAVECKLVADAMAGWLMELEAGARSCAVYDVPRDGEGMGLTEGPRGALGHWIRVENGVIANYQAVVPTTWNCSPRDDNEQPGACEQALEGTAVRDPENPFELVRIVRSFDPCLACAIHMVSPTRGTIAACRVA